jgi:electron transport complex protein RnfG
MNETGKRQGNFLAQGWLVILLAILYGGALAGVQIGLGPRIRENKRNETYDQIPRLVEGAVKERTEEIIVVDKAGRPTRVYRAINRDGTLCGWVLPAAGQGFADRIELLVGLDARMSVLTGLFVLDQKETPGLGDYITGRDFRERFLGKSTAQPLVVVVGDAETDDQIQALTGATISSQSVADIVNGAIKNLKEPVLQQPE